MGRIERVVDRTRYSIVLIALLAVSCGQGAQGSGSDASFVPVENPTNEHAWQLFQQAKHEESMREYKSVLLKDDKDANAHYGVACNLDSLGKYEEALAEYNIAYSLNPEHTGVLNDRGNLYGKLKQYDKEIADYSRAIELEPWNAANWNDRSSAYLDIYKDDLALKDATESVIRDGEYVNPHYYRGVAFWRMGENKKALIALRAALDYEPTFANAHDLMGNIYSENENFRKAIDHYTQALTLRPKQYYFYVKRANSYDELGKHDDALRDLKRAVELAPEKSYARDALFKHEYLMEHGNLSDAELFPIGCCALLDHMNEHRHDILMPDIPTKKNIEAEKRSLRVNGWSVNSRDDLLKNLKYLEDGGNRALFDEIATALKSSDPDKAFDELLKRHSETYGREKLLDRRTVVAKYGDKLGKKSLVGWDMIRYIHLCRWGALAGYMSEEEAWNRIKPVAQKLQKTFDSWEDLGDNYLIGRRFWNKKVSLEGASEFQKIVDWLKTNKDSPWVKVDWNTDLS